MKKAGIIESKRRRLEEVHENLEAPSTACRVAFCQTEVCQTKYALRKNIEKKTRLLENKCLSKNMH